MCLAGSRQGEREAGEWRDTLGWILQGDAVFWTMAMPKVIRRIQPDGSEGSHFN